MTNCDFSKNDTQKFIFCSEKGSSKNGTYRTSICGNYARAAVQYCINSPLPAPRQVTDVTEIFLESNAFPTPFHDS